MINLIILISLLDGAAARAIKGLTLSEGNYSDAIELLKQRFGRPQQIICAHMEELVKIPSCTNDRPQSLRYVYDQITVHIRGLATLGIGSTQYGSLLIPIIMSKLPGEIRLRVARETKDDVWSLDDLMDVIRVEVEAREASEGVKMSAGKPPLPSGRPPQGNSGATATALSASQMKVKCAYCNGDHFSASCSKVQNVQDRKKLLLSANRCFNCLKSDHKVRDCTSTKTCRHCHRKHHQSLCDRLPPLKESSSETVDTTNNTANTSTRSSQTVLLQTARVVAFGESKQPQAPVRVLFDSGSQLSYISEKLQRQLKLKPMRIEKLHLNTFGTAGYKSQSCGVVKLSLKKPGLDEVVTISALSSPVICSALPSAVNVISYSHLNDLVLADSGTDEQGTIDVLVGSNYYWAIVTGDLRRGEEGPVAVSSKLGWLLSGPISSLGSSPLSHTHLSIASGFDNSCEERDVELLSVLRKFWDTESIGVIDTSENDVNELFLPSIRFEGTRYEVELPWIDGHPEVPYHLNMCQTRLKLLQRRLCQRPELMQEYSRIIQEQINLGIVETVEPETSRNKMIHYLPHHGVVRMSSETTKLRIVYDGSARSAGDICSLNDCLQKGPNYIPKLFEVLIRFRFHQVAVTADIEKAFLMIGIRESDRDLLRFLWLKTPSTPQSEIVHLRFARLVFGLRPSPAILGAVISHHLNKYKETIPELVNKMQESLYVDDLVSGTSTVEEAISFYSEAKGVMSAAGMNLRKWKSNSEKLLDHIKESEKGDSLQPSKGEVAEEDESFAKATTGYITKTGDDTIKLLGVAWNSSSDEFTFDYTELLKYVESLNFTKRSLLKFTAKLFDPLGFLSPYVIQLKILFQRLCIDHKNWDDPLHGEVQRKWREIISELPFLSRVKVPRCYFESGTNASAVQLHGFCDASSNAYAAVIYLRSTYESGHVEVRIVTSKTRVAPTKTQTIPRLELLGALILSRLAATVVDSLPINPTPFYWTDSTTVLHWICNHKQWKQYVSNRVNEIRSHSSASSWRHCPGTCNPADLPSRGVNGESLLSSELWWSGPKFLQLPEEKWPEVTIPPTSSIAESELVKNPSESTHTLVANLSSPERNLGAIIDCSRVGSFLKLLRVTTYVLRFARLVRPPSASNCEVTPSELNTAELYWIQSVQAKAFAPEMSHLMHPSQPRPIRVSQFNLFLSEDRLLKCKGRIGNANVPDEAKNPTLLPSRHPFVDLLIFHVHVQIKHSGISDTLSTLRGRYWILKGRQAVKRVLHSCVVCSRFEGLPYSSVKSPDLPDLRVSEDAPFTNTGIDFAGPLYTFETSSADCESNKAYVCLFTCASTRAVHLELARDLSVSTFLRLFRRFVSRRGLPTTLISDNAKTFKASSQIIAKIARSSEVIHFFNNHRITWKFIVERAPWWGGFWERLIRSVKRCLKRSIGQANLSFDELHTVIVEIEAILNARPITYLYDDQDGISTALSPSHLLYGRKVTSMPNDETFEILSTYQSLTRKAKRHQHLLSQFMNQWRKEYLLNLREHHLLKDKKKGRLPVEVGDVVVVKSDVSNRAFWRLGMIEELIPGSDGNVRAAVVKVGDKSGGKRTVLLRRSIKHLYPLEEKAKPPLSMREEPAALKSANDKINSDLSDSPPELSTKSNTDNLPEQEDIESVADDEMSGRRPRRQAAIAGEELRRKRM